MTSKPVHALALAAALVLAGAVPHAAAQAPAAAATEFSRAERLLFMTDQLGRMALPSTLRYSFARSGTLEPAFQDRVSMAIAREPDGACCHITAQFLTAEREVRLPDIDRAQANPALLYFLERDVRDMQRLTKGSPSYYRKRIRMAVYDSARVLDTEFDLRGSKVAGQRIEISPYLDDPARPRYEKFARKTYQFDLSDAVPGGIVALRSVMRSADDAAAPMIVEELNFEDAATTPTAAR